MKNLLLLSFLITLNLSFTFAQEKKAGIDDMWLTYTFYPASVDEFYSMNDGETYTMLNNGIIIEQYSFKSGKLIKELLNINTIKQEGEKPTSIKSYEFSKDESKILITTDIEKIYRHSQKAEHWIYDVKTGKISRLSDKGKQMLASFSPDGKKAAFVRDNNIFVKDLVKEIETQITNDGKWAEIINGAPDWVYEEEFSFSKAFEWSDDSKFIAF
jgi:dipeptidyl-peptidase-4